MTSVPQETTAPDDIETRALTTAMEIMREGGLDHLTMEEVTKRSGIAKTTLYRRWASAEELAIRSVKSMVKAETAPANTGNLKGDLRVHFQTLVDLTEDRGFRLVVLSLMSASVTNPVLADVRADMDAMRRDLMHHMVDAARERGEITRVFTDDQLAAIVEGPITMMRIHQMLDITNDDLNVLIDSVAAALTIA